MDMLKRSLAPLTDAAWEAVDETIRNILVTRLCGRKVVDVSGPHGPARAAVGTGRLRLPDDNEREGVRYGIHEVRPLVEGRVNFELNVWEMDNVERGARDVDLGPAERAALAMARFEDAAIFKGFAAAGITGLTQLAENDPVPLPLETPELLEALTRAVMTLHDRAVAGPYGLVVGPRVFAALGAEGRGYPLRKRVEDLIGGPVLYSEVLDGALLVSRRGGDLELILGQDLAVGFERYDARTATLYIAESFTFRVLDAKACVNLPLKAA